MYKRELDRFIVDKKLGLSSTIFATNNEIFIILMSLVFLATDMEKYASIINIWLTTLRLFQTCRLLISSNFYTSFNS